MGKQWKQWLILFFWAPKSLRMVIAAMKLKNAYPWKESYDQPRQQAEILLCPSRQGYGFSSGYVWM